MKASIITLHAVVNYGSALQAFATQYIFNQLGCDSEIVDYRRKSTLSKTIGQIILSSDYTITQKIKLVLIQPSSKMGRRIFDEFISNHLTLTPHQYIDVKDFESFPIDADLYCTGSDQVWNTSWENEISKPFFLDYAPSGKPRIAFSASFGKDKLDEWEKAEIRDFLNKYTSISVREKSAVDIINSLNIGIEAKHVLDPTLAVTPNVWQNLAKPDRIVKEKYILIYQLNNNKQFDNYSKNLAAKKKLKLIRLCTRYDQLRKTGQGIILPKVEEFLSLIRDAEYVLTDSFHGIAFCLIFHKRFIVFFPELYSTRLKSILSLTHMQGMVLNDCNDYSLIDKPIDYVSIDSILDKERQNTLQFLDNVIHNSNHKCCK